MNYSKKPADGERNARIGYEAQDKRAANLIYDILIQGRLDCFKIADPDAGRVDDIQITTIDGELHAYQVKWSETVEPFPFATFIRPDGLIKQLADGWRQLKSDNPDKRVHVHLIHRHIADYRSPLKGRDKKVKLPLDKIPPLKSNFQGFIQDCWEDKCWLNTKSYPQGWQNALNEIYQICGFSSNKECVTFIAASHLHFGYQFPESGDFADYSTKRRFKDVEQIARLIARLGGGNKRIIPVNKAYLLRKLDWESHFEFRFKHEFPIDEILYQPIEQTVAKLDSAIGQFNSGYLALLGTPGSGKSTTLTHTLRYRQGFQVIRYYAYVPESTWQEARGEAASFLHDLHLALQRQGIYARTDNQSQPESVEELRQALITQFSQLHEKWIEEKIQTLIIIDGLDHIEREQSPERSLLKELPLPEDIPEGVLLILGSQTLQLADLQSRISHHLAQPGRTLIMQPLPKMAVFNIIKASQLPLSLSLEQEERIYALSNEHPLALRYLLANLRNVTSTETVEQILDSTTPFQKDIEENYHIYWDKLQQNDELKKLLALLARLRGAFNKRTLLSWVDEPVIKFFLEQARHYFREESDIRWDFFHNSFRQFILKQTRLNVFDELDLTKDKTYHQYLADYAATAIPNSLWAWEEIYHRSKAEDWDKVLQLGTQAYFREQFMSLRSLEAILEDTALCLKAAQTKQDGLTIIRMFLIEKELGDRNENLTWSNIDLPRLLYAVQGMDMAMHVMDGQQLRIDEKEALQFVVLLIEKDHLKVAETVFNIAEPLALLNGSVPVDHLRGNLETLYAWVDVAHNFRSLDKLITVIQQLRADVSHIWKDQSPEDWHRNLQQNVLMRLMFAVFNSDDENKLRQLQELLEQREDREIFLQNLDIEICSARKNKESAETALKRLLRWAKKGKPEPHTQVLLAEFLFRIQHNKEAVAKWITNIPQPPLYEASSNHHDWDDLNPFYPRIILNRLLASLGKLQEPVHAVPDDDERYGGVLFERCVVIISNLWGQAWAGNILFPDTILHEIKPALTLFYRTWNEIRGFWYSYEKSAPDFYRFMVHAVAQHGQEALNVLGTEFDHQWQIQPQYWKTAWQRTIALTLYHQGGTKEDLIHKLRRFLKSN
jgi:hypothetical protein